MSPRVRARRGAARAWPLLALVALAAAAPAAQTADSTRLTFPDPWLGQDKAAHLVGSAALTALAHVAWTQGAGLDGDAALPFAATVSLSAGLAKELSDERRVRRPQFSWRDLAADALGTAAAVALIAWLDGG